MKITSLLEAIDQNPASIALKIRSLNLVAMVMEGTKVTKRQVITSLD